MAIFSHTSESSNVPAIQGVFQVRGDPKIGAPEITPRRGGADPAMPDDDADPLLVESYAQDRFNLAVDHCRGVNKGLGYFHKNKYNLGKAIDAAYDLFCAVREYPELEDQLRDLDILKDRKRKLGKAKLHLLCVYCALQPKTEDDYKNCSDYTAFLLQAEHENKNASDFADWIKGKTLKACLRDVRDRKRAEASDRASHTAPSVSRRLSIRHTSTGVHGSLDGRKFELPEEVLTTIVTLIETECFTGAAHEHEYP